MEFYVYGITNKGKVIAGKESDFEKAKILFDKANKECDGVFKSGYILTQEEAEAFNSIDRINDFFVQAWEGQIKVNLHIGKHIHSWLYNCARFVQEEK